MFDDRARISRRLADEALHEAVKLDRIADFCERLDFDAANNHLAIDEHPVAIEDQEFERTAATRLH